MLSVAQSTTPLSSAVPCPEAHSLHSVPPLAAESYLTDRCHWDRQGRIHLDVSHPDNIRMPGTARLGSWRMDAHCGIHGHEIEQLRRVPLDRLDLPELDRQGRLSPEKRGDEEHYARLMDAGHQPPPVHAIQRDDGSWRVIDGHRRSLAHRLRGDSHIRAWLSPTMPHPDGLVDAGGRVLQVGMTFEGARSAMVGDGACLRRWDHGLISQHSSDTVCERIRAGMLPTHNALGQAIAQDDRGLAAFWRWYEGSALVDQSGRPVVCYHGTDAAEDFRSFDPRRAQTDRGIYLSMDPAYASGYALFAAAGGRVIPAYVRLEQPYWCLTKPSGMQTIGGDWEHWPVPNDGMVVGTLDHELHPAIAGRRAVAEEIVARYPEQVKSTLANGAFDPRSADICG